MGKFPHDNFAETSLIQYIRRIVNRFVTKGGVNKRKSLLGLNVSNEVVALKERFEQCLS